MKALSPLLLLSLFLATPNAARATESGVDAPSVTSLAEGALLAGQASASADLARAAIRANPQDGQAYLILGLALEREDRYAEAADAYRVVARMTAQRAPALRLLARALTRSAAIDEAVKVYAALRRMTARPLNAPAPEVAAR